MARRLIILALALTNAGFASSITWLTNGPGAAWNVGSNWSTGTVPTSTDSVTVNAGATFQPQIVLNGDAHDLNIATGASVTVTDLNVLTITSTGAGTGIGLDGTLNLSGALQNSDLQVVGTGTVSLLGSGTLAMNGPNSRIYAGNAMVLNNLATIAGQGTIGTVGAALSLNNTETINSNVNGGNLTIFFSGNAADNSNSGTLQATNGGTLSLDTLSPLTNTNGKISANGGTVNLAGGFMGGTLEAINGGTLNANIGLIPGLGGTVGLTGVLNVTTGVVLQLGDIAGNNGSLTLNNSAATSGITVADGAALKFFGTTDLKGGTLSLTDTDINHITATPGSNAVLNNHATIQGSGDFANTSGLYTFAINNYGTVEANQASSMSFNPGTVFTNYASVIVDAGSTLSIGNGFTQYSGTMQVDGQLNAVNMDLEGGTLKGVGTLSGSVENNGGIIAPGDSPGTLLMRVLNQGAGGEVDIEIASLMSYDRLIAGDGAILDGTLKVILDGYTGHLGDQFSILQSGNVQGNFATFILPTLANGLFFVESTDANNVYLTVQNGSVTATPEPATFGLLSGGLALAGLIRIRKNRS